MDNTARNNDDTYQNMISPKIEDAIPAPIDFRLDVSNPDYIVFTIENLTIEVIGGIRDEMLSTLKVAIKVYKIGAVSPLEIYRNSLVNLFDEHQVHYTITKASERLKIESSRFKNIFYDFIERVDNYRRNRGKVVTPVYSIPSEIKSEAKAVLTQDNLIQSISELLSRAGISDTRLGLQLFIASISRITDTPIHSIVNAPQLLANELIKEFIPIVPKEHLHEVTTISKHALSYPPTENFWEHKTLVLHQLESIKGKGDVLLEYLMHGQSKRLVTQSDERTGNYQSHKRDVTSTISLISYTAKDHHPVFTSKHSLVIPLKETNSIQEKLYEKEVKELAGLLDHETADVSAKILQQMVRELKSMKVYNPIIEQVDVTAFFGNDIKSLGLYLRLVNMYTLLHQHQSLIKLTKSGQVIDVETKYMITILELYREVWLKKDDELYFNVRGTFNSLKQHLRDQYSTGYLGCTFKLKEVRKVLGKSPVTLQRHFNTLEMYGKIERCGGNNRIGYDYKVLEWQDSYSKIKAYNKLLNELKEL